MDFKDLDKLVKEKMVNQPRRYAFNLSEIEERIELPFLTKHGEQFYLYRKEFRHKHHTPINTDLYTIYFIVSADGDVCGRIPVYANEKPNMAAIDYFLKPDYKNKGIGSVATMSIVSQVFAGQVLDGFEFNTNQGQVKTHIDELRLAINIDNYPSRALAQKLGFIEDENDPTQFILRKENYFHKNHNREK